MGSEPGITSGVLNDRVLNQEDEHRGHEPTRDSPFRLVRFAFDMIISIGIRFTPYVALQINSKSITRWGLEANQGRHGVSQNSRCVFSDRTLSSNAPCPGKTSPMEPAYLRSVSTSWTDS